MTEIHYFPRYSQRENFVTNNTLLLLLRLHQYNRLKFERFLETTCADQEIQLASSWLHFRQQTGTDRSVLDGYIAQDSLKVAVETKLGTAFDLEQLERHLGVFGSEQHKLLILLNPTREAMSSAQLKTIRDNAAPRNIQIVHTTFEEVIRKAEECLSQHDEEMLALVADYESFCSEEGLLPRDRYTMFVPPCSQSLADNVEGRLYYCPATRSLRKAKYLGVYADKAVRAIGRIADIAVCDVDLESGEVTVHEHEATRDLSEDEKRRIVTASRQARGHGWDISGGHKFLLCDEMVGTEFNKTSPGGIMGHRYFDLEEVLGGRIPESLDALAGELRGRRWG